MSISSITRVTVYCDGGVHSPLEFSLRSFPPRKAELDDLVRRAGWTVRPGYKYYCEQHR